jgi:hypothetical protein
VYIYNRRLLLVHEYHADSSPGLQQAVYGEFLIEQALLGAAPSLATSINRSSIKRRLIMLTHKSHGRAKLKLLLVVPLLAVCLCCFTKNSLANKPNKEGNVCKWRGNTIEFLAPKKPDSYLYKDETTGKISRRAINWPAPPIKLNGKEIYDAERHPDVVPSTALAMEDGLAAYILEQLRYDLEKLKDGNYFIVISDIVIDENGRIAYFQNDGIGPDDSIKNRQILNDKIDELLAAAPAYEPAKLNNARVPCFARSLFAGTFGYGPGADFTIQNHKLTYGNRAR